MKLPAALLLCVAFPALAQPVYRCEEDGSVTYTDRPCSSTAQPHALPPVIVAAPPTAAERALAQAHDRREAQDLADRERADAEWLKRHADASDRAARVRQAIVEHRVIKGMTFEEVRLALGDPQQTAGGDSFGTAKETWTWRNGEGTRTVHFKDGQVTSTSGRRAGRGNRQTRSAKSRTRKQ